MRRRFDVQLALGQIPIERVRIPLKSRDELPPILAGLQWIFQTPQINEQVFALLESKVIAGKRATGRPGLDLWTILVLGVVRLGLDCDYDRLEDLANHHTLLRQILGVSPGATAEEKPFHYKTLSDNVCHLDEELLAQINALVAQAGRAVFKKKDAPEPIRAKTDSYVLETNVHFPTDVNLLWDAQRKCLDLICPLMNRHGLAGWRKAKAWRRKLKTQMIGLTRLASGGGPWRPDLVLMATFGQKIPNQIIALPRLGFFNFHHSGPMWPSYPGPDPIAAMIRDGCKDLVLTMHTVTDVIDGGEFVARSHRVAIPEGVNAIQMHRITWPQMADFIRRSVSDVLDTARLSKPDSAWAIHEDSVEYFVGVQASEQICARRSADHCMAGLRASR